MDNYVIALINRAKEEVDPAEWFIGKSDLYDCSEDAAWDLFPEGMCIQGSMVSAYDFIAIARVEDDEPRVHTDIAPMAVVYSKKLDIYWDVYPII